jgi:hypothetical protein
MHMVWHQAIGPALNAVGPAALCQKIAVERIIAVFQKDRLTPVATLRHMVRQIRDGDAGETGRGGIQAWKR